MLVCRFLRRDYRILVSAPGQGLASVYAKYYTFGILGAVMFALAVPLAYAIILYSIRNRLEVQPQLPELLIPCSGHRATDLP